MAKTRTKILVLEDNPLLREGIAGILKTHRDFQLVAAAANAHSTVLKIHNLKPDVILLDLGLRSQNSLHMVETLKTEFPNARIVVMDLSPAQADILQFIQAGASGFILKDATTDTFIDTLRSVSAGKKVLPPILNESVFSQIIDHAIRGGRVKLREGLRITKREREVIELISDGSTNKQIANRLHIATHTVKSHIHNIMEKLTLHSRLEVANFASANATTTRKMVRTISMIGRSHHPRPKDVVPFSTFRPIPRREPLP